MNSIEHIQNILYIYKIPSSTKVRYQKSPWKYNNTRWTHTTLPLTTHVLPNTTNNHYITLSFNPALYIPIFRNRFHHCYHFVDLIKKKCSCTNHTCPHIIQANVIRNYYLSILFIRYIHRIYLYRIPITLLEPFLITKPIVFTTPLRPS